MKGPYTQHRSLWAWNVSSLAYERTYLRVAHQADSDLLKYLGCRIQGATVADCGCGPGVVAEKLLHAGARRVVALDSNARMLQRARRRLARPIAEKKVVLHHGTHESCGLPRMQRALEIPGFDLVLFKRSLYMPRPRALATLRAAARTLASRGMIVVIHPERALRRYAFAPPLALTRYTLFHLFNRAISLTGQLLGIEEYALYSRGELSLLLSEAVPEARVEFIPSRQRPYNLAALHFPRFVSRPGHEIG